MVKRIVYTDIMPLPSNIPRQLALDMLHAHAEIISLNPLVTGSKPIEAPRDASADEYFAQWHEISEIITWGFGLKKKISFKGCFHDLPNGLQTHVYAPMGVDLRQKFQIRGNQPGEPREVRELGIDAPADGLYLRYDVEILCNIAFSPFVKKETKAATGTMMERLSRKAELLDEGVLHALFENGRLKTVNPLKAGAPGQVQHRETMRSQLPPSPDPSTPGSPQPSIREFPEKQFTRYSDLPGRRSSQSSRADSYMPSYQQAGYKGPADFPPIAELGAEQFGNTSPPVEVEGSITYNSSNQRTSPPQPNIQAFRSELADTSVPITLTSSQEQTPAQPYVHPAQTISYTPRTSPSPRFSYTYTPTGDARPSPLQPRRRSGSGNPPYPTNDRSSRTSSSFNRSTSGTDETHYNRSSRTSSGYMAPLTGTDDSHNPRHPSRLPSTASSCSSYTTQQSDLASHNGGGSISVESQLQALTNQVQGLGIAGSSPRLGDAQPVGRASPLVSQCPICFDFEGDETAVNHHVQVQHFG